MQVFSPHPFHLLLDLPSYLWSSWSPGILLGKLHPIGQWDSLMRGEEGRIEEGNVWDCFSSSTSTRSSLYSLWTSIFFFIKKNKNNCHLTLQWVLGRKGIKWDTPKERNLKTIQCYGNIRSYWNNQGCMGVGTMKQTE